jgi:hypothetical protein
LHIARIDDLSGIEGSMFAERQSGAMFSQFPVGQRVPITIALRYLLASDRSSKSQGSRVRTSPLRGRRDRNGDLAVNIARSRDSGAGVDGIIPALLR